jgi:hypothetical protein
MVVDQLIEILDNLNQIKKEIEQMKEIQLIRTLEIKKILQNWQRADHIRLHAGEMTAQEMRSVKAVVKAIEANINETLSNYH